jgi:hypothetical protein
MSYPNHIAPADASTPTTGSLETVRFIIGLAVLVCGACGAAFILRLLYNLVINGVDPPFIAKLSELRQIAIDTPQGQLKIPAGFGVASTYGLLGFLMSIAAAISNAMIRAGASLMQPEIKHVLRAIERGLSRQKSNTDA